ncbi:MAG: hypothetical protein ACRDGH_16785, partial [Candidatus Limnocylindria bacterium]
MTRPAPVLRLLDWASSPHTSVLDDEVYGASRYRLLPHMGAVANALDRSVVEPVGVYVSGQFFE